MFINHETLVSVSLGSYMSWTLFLLVILVSLAGLLGLLDLDHYGSKTFKLPENVGIFHTITNTPSQVQREFSRNKKPYGSLSQSFLTIMVLMLTYIEGKICEVNVLYIVEHPKINLKVERVNRHKSCKFAIHVILSQQFSIQGKNLINQTLNITLSVNTHID